MGSKLTRLPIAAWALPFLFLPIEQPKASEISLGDGGKARWEACQRSLI